MAYFQRSIIIGVLKSCNRSNWAIVNCVQHTPRDFNGVHGKRFFSIKNVPPNMSSRWTNWSLYGILAVGLAGGAIGFKNITEWIKQSINADDTSKTFVADGVSDTDGTRSGNDDYAITKWMKRTMRKLHVLASNETDRTFVDPLQLEQCSLGFRLMGHTTGEPVRTPIPGDQASMSSKALDMGAVMMQNFTPVNQIHQHVCGFHFYAENMDRQVEAHHYCSHLNEDFRQCVIYDTTDKDAKLIGIEYIISKKLFDSLPDDEKAYWHSHVYEVKSGLIFTPAVPEKAEDIVMENLIGTYGKTWHLWQVDRGDPLPIGPAKLMLAFTKDGQIHQKMLDARDKRMGVSTAEKKKRRKYIPEPKVHPRADQFPNPHA